MTGELLVPHDFVVPESEVEGLAAAERALARGDLVTALSALLPVLERRDEAGATLAARLLRAQDEAAAAPAALAAAVDRLAAVVAMQEEQIDALRGLVEERL